MIKTKRMTTDPLTDPLTHLVTSSLLELLIAAKNSRKFRESYTHSPPTPLKFRRKLCPHKISRNNLQRNSKNGLYPLKIMKETCTTSNPPTNPKKRDTNWIYFTPFLKINFIEVQMARVI